MAENSDYTGYRSALSSRYATKEMQFLFSDQFKFSTWRKLWIFLAQAEKVFHLTINSYFIAEVMFYFHIFFLCVTLQICAIVYMVMTQKQIQNHDCPLDNGYCRGQLEPWKARGRFEIEYYDSRIFAFYYRVHHFFIFIF